MVTKEFKKLVKMDYKLYSVEKWANFRSSIQRLNLQKHVTLHEDVYAACDQVLINLKKF